MSFASAASALVVVLVTALAAGAVFTTLASLASARAPRHDAPSDGSNDEVIVQEDLVRVVVASTVFVTLRHHQIARPEVPGRAEGAQTFGLQRQRIEDVDVTIVAGVS